MEGEVNPVRDLDIIHEELRLKDMEYLDKTIHHMEKNLLRGNDKQHKVSYVSLFYMSNSMWSCFLDDHYSLFTLSKAHKYISSPITQVSDQNTLLQHILD